MDERELIYDWKPRGRGGGTAFDWSRVRVDLKRRDAARRPAIPLRARPTLEVKKTAATPDGGLGNLAADIGLPGAGRAW